MKRVVFCIAQGIMITVGVFIANQYAASKGFNEAITQTLVLIGLNA